MDGPLFPRSQLSWGLLTFEIDNINLQAISGGVWINRDYYVLLCMPCLRKFGILGSVNNTRFRYVKVVRSPKWFNGRMLTACQICHSTETEMLTCPVPFKGL